MALRKAGECLLHAEQFSGLKRCFAPCRRGFATLDAAATDALAAIDACRGPARGAAPRLQIARAGALAHSPDKDGWAAAMTAVHDALSLSARSGEV